MLIKKTTRAVCHNKVYGPCFGNQELVQQDDQTDTYDTYGYITGVKHNYKAVTIAMRYTYEPNWALKSMTATTATEIEVFYKG